MRTIFGALRLFPVFAVAVAIVSCDKHEAPTTPTGGQPQIASISPVAIHPSDAPQSLAFVGTGFGAGLQLLVTAPSGNAIVVDSTGLQSIQPTSFEATLILNQTGTYSFAVRNAAGSTSPVVAVVVQPFGSVLPVVYSVTPAAVPRNTVQATLVALQGANFTEGAAIIITDPNGQTMVITPASLSQQSATTIQFSFTFSVRGTYSIVVNNPDGVASNPVSIQVT